MIPKQLQHIQLLMDILLRHRCQARNLRNARRVLTALYRDRVMMHNRRVPCSRRRDLRLAQQLHDHFAPVLAVAQQSQITQWLLRRAQLTFPLTELVAESNEQSAETFTLILWECQDTCHVVPFGTFFLLAKIANDVAAALVARGHYIEQEGVNVVIESLVIEEQFTQQTEVSTPGPLPPAVDFEK